MPLDHYVSQVHLRNFAAPDGMLRAIKKSDLKGFPTRPQDVCRIEGGSTNPFLDEPRLVEEYLKGIEPPYNASVQKIRDDKIDIAAIRAIAGFVLYVIICSSTGSRLQSKPVEERLLMEARKLDAGGGVPNAPVSLGGKTLTELLRDGTVKFEIDSKFPQAIGVENFDGRISMFGNSRWEVLLNGREYGPYFTSDYPVAIETFDTDTPINRIVPLAPDIAVRIIPDKNLKGMKPDLTFSAFTSTRQNLRPQSVMELNRKLVQCAEDFVFFGEERAWIPRFVTKNRMFRIEPTTFSVMSEGKKALLVSHRIRRR